MDYRADYTKDLHDNRPSWTLEGRANYRADSPFGPTQCSLLYVVGCSLINGLSSAPPLGVARRNDYSNNLEIQPISKAAHAIP
jgi:hypothetical protein